MSVKNESMLGIMKLYDLRREATMRQAREWFAGFSPASPQDIEETLKGSDDHYFRMVLTYWEMAATFVNHGAIDEQMFQETHAEHVSIFAKVEPFIAELRAATKTPTLLANLEQLVLRVPNAQERMAEIRERAKAKQAPAKEVANAAVGN